VPAAAEVDPSAPSDGKVFYILRDPPSRFSYLPGRRLPPTSQPIPHTRPAPSYLFFLEGLFQERRTSSVSALNPQGKERPSEAVDG